MDHKQHIEDEVYENLRGSFLHHGKGRPKSLKPGIEVNNKLLVQLYYLREEGSKPWTVIADWLSKIDPVVAEISEHGTATHFFSDLVDRTVKLFLTQDDTTRAAFLKLPVDLNFISDSLSELGIFRSTFSTPPNEQTKPSAPVSNRAVVDFEIYRSTQRLPFKPMFQWLSQMTGYEENKLLYAVTSVYKTYLKLNKCRSRKPEKVNNFLSLPFVLPGSRAKTTSASVAPGVTLPMPTATPILPPSPQANQPNPPASMASGITLPTPTAPPILSTSPSANSPMLTIEANPPESVAIGNTLPMPTAPSILPTSASGNLPMFTVQSNLPASVVPETNLPSPTRSILPSSTAPIKRPPKHCDVDTETLLHVIDTLQSESASNHITIQTLNCELNKVRKELQFVKSSIKDRTIKVRETNKLQQQVLTFKNKNKDLSQELKKIHVENDNLKSKIVQLKSKVKSLHQENVQLKRDFIELESKIDQGKNFEVKVRRGVKNAYSDEIRKVVISLMGEAGVSAKNVSKVIEIVAFELFNFKFNEPLPCPYTCIKICDEGYVVSQIQATERLLDSQNVTIHCDGTSRDQKKIISHQLSTDCGDTLFLGFQPIGSENADSVLDLSVDVLRTLASTYQDLSDLSAEDLFFQLIKRITSTMTDRASTMKSFVRKLESYFQSELSSDFSINFLHCNAHFLLGLSSACEKALFCVERDVCSGGNLLGRDVNARLKIFNKESETATGRAIRLTCEVLGPRGDQKNGCRNEWTAFESNSTIPSFKANRFNCFFEAAAAIIYHRGKIINFFYTRCFA